NMREIGSIGRQSLLDTVNAPDHYQLDFRKPKLFHRLQQIFDAFSLGDQAHKQQAKFLTRSAMMGRSQQLGINSVRWDSDPFSRYAHLDQAFLHVVGACQHQVRKVDLVACAIENPVNHSLVGAWGEVWLQFRFFPKETNRGLNMTYHLVQDTKN